MSYLSITVEIDPGAIIPMACREMQALADKLGVTVKAQANGVTCMAIPGGSSQVLAHRQFEAQRDRMHCKLVTSRG